MRTAILAVMAAATTLAGCATYGDDRYRSYSAYDYDRVDPSYNGYYADRYYVDNARYRERRLSSNDRIYRGQDGRTYCRRNDGTTGLGDNQRVSKSSLRVQAMGDVDELNSQLGVLLAEPLPADVRDLLVTIQHELFNLGGELSWPGGELLKDAAVLRLDEALARCAHRRHRCDRGRHRLAGREPAGARDAHLRDPQRLPARQCRSGRPRSARHHRRAGLGDGHTRRSADGSGRLARLLGRGR